VFVEIFRLVGHLLRRLFHLICKIS